MADHILTESGLQLKTESGAFLVLALDFIPAGFIFVSAELGTFVGAFSESAIIPTAVDESSVIGSGG